MAAQKIHFFSEEIAFTLPNKKKYRAIILQTISQHQFKLKELNYIFCNDEYLLSINQEYLNHNTYTDIITFDNSSTEKTIEGDIFISVERIKENAEKFNQTFQDELTRVMGHGLLHLLGYKDKTNEQSNEMRRQENLFIQIFHEN
jgi:rRNA maturation RNase YbeY